MILCVLLLLVVIEIGGVTGLSEYFYKLYGCHPPVTLRARIELIGFDNDRNFDGVVSKRDLDINSLEYNYDGNMEDLYPWEMIFHWRCRYGFDEEFNRFFFHRLDRNGDGLLGDGDFPPTFSMPGAVFRQNQLDAFRGYCTANNNTPPRDCWRIEAERNTLANFGNFSLPQTDYDTVRS